MQQIFFSSLHLWQFDLLSSERNIMHFVSGRGGGVTPGEMGSLNLSFNVGDEAGNVQENRERLAKALGILSQNLIFPIQTHSLNIKHVQTGKESLEETDAIISDTKGICLAVMSADCVPVLLYDPIRKACAAVHAGWKGTVGGIVSATVQEMKRTFGTVPSDLLACIGPSIGPDVYEVGTEVMHQVEKALGAKDCIITEVGHEGKGLLNLWEANKLQLLSEGVKSINIEVSGICTHKNSDQFFSFRKSKNNTGRFAAGILLI